MSERTEIRSGFEAGSKGERPAGCETEHLEYLDALRLSGATNMFGARPYILEAFPELTSPQASAILGYWMKTFGDATR